MVKKTTISVSAKTRDSLRECKIYPHESYEEIINRLIKRKHQGKNLLSNG